MRVGFQHGIENDEELAHASGHDELEGLARGFESLGEGANDRVAAFGSECGHVENTSNRGASSPDASLTLESTAVVVERSETDERTDLLSIQLSEFGKLSQESRGGGGPDAGGALEDLGLAAPVVVGCEEGEDRFFDLLNVFVETIDQMLNALSNGAGCTRFETIGFGGSEVDELATTEDELLKFGLIIGGLGHGARPNLLTEPGDDGSIDAIGLGENSNPASEITNLTRIDDGHEMTGIEEIGDDASLISPGGFEDDQASSWCGKLATKLLQGALVIGQGERPAFGEQTHIEGMLGDIDADERCERTIHGTIPVLQMRARRTPALAAVRADSKKPTTITLRDGLGRPRRNRSVIGRRGAGCSAALRSRPHGVVHLTT